jgi:hypothetical protein
MLENWFSSSCIQSFDVVLLLMVDPHGKSRLSHHDRRPNGGVPEFIPKLAMKSGVEDLSFSDAQFTDTRIFTLSVVSDRSRNLAASK